MNWLIAEDALLDRKGHWFEYVRAFRNGLLQLGDRVDVLASRKAESFVLSALEAEPVLPESIWHRMNDGSPAWKRHLRVPIHAWRTWRSAGRWLKEHDDYDLIFVPTVSVHHLLGWYWLIKRLLPNTRVQVLLYFLSMPITKTGDEKPRWISSPTTYLLRKLFSWLGTAVKSGRVILGVETGSLKNALESLTGLPVHCLAQPVEAFASQSGTPSNGLLMGCYGGARCEKGSELLQSAIARYLELYPQSRSRFAVQWIDDLQNEKGRWVRINPSLAQNQRVTFIREYFGDGEYARWLGQTQVLLLPYQCSSYNLRGSRVVIEAMVHGIPAVVTCGTTLAEQAEQFGAAVLCEDGNVDSLLKAIHYAEENIHDLLEQAEQRKAAARAHFSVCEFRRRLLALAQLRS